VGVHVRTRTFTATALRIEWLRESLEVDPVGSKYRNALKTLCGSFAVFCYKRVATHVFRDIGYLRNRAV
jgi:hypothetical protein